MKGSRIIILVLGIAVAAAMIWQFAGRGPADTKPAADTEAKAPVVNQQQVAEEIQPAPDPNQLQRPLEARRGRRGRRGDANEPFGENFGPMAGTMGMDMPMGMDMMDQGASDVGGAAESDSNPLEAVNLQDVSMRDIIRKVSEWTGKAIIPTADSVMQQKVTIVAPTRIRRSEALALIFAALRLRGVAVEQSDNVIFLKPTAESRAGMVPAIPPDMPLAGLTDKNQVVQKTFVLKNYRPTKIYSLLAPTIAPYGHIAADDNTGNVIIIETVENLMRMERMIARLDRPQPKGSEERIFQLTTGDASAIAQVVERLMNTGIGQYGPAEDANRPADRTGVTSISIAQKSDSVMLVPETNGNWIIARAWPEDMEIIGQWIDRLDKEMQVSPDYDVLQVRYVDVTELADRVSGTLQSMPGITLRSSVLLQPLPRSRQIMLFGSADRREMVRRLVAEIDQPGSSLFEERTFLLRHADPDFIKTNIDNLYGTAVSTMAQMMQQGGGRRFSAQQTADTANDTVRAISHPSLGQITVIASPEQMVKIARQIEEWDVPIPLDRMKPRIIELANSDPVKMSDLLSRLFSQDQAAATSTDMRNVFAAFMGAAGANRQGIVGPLYGQLTFEAVPDTRKIIVISKNPAAYDVVEALIRDLDRQELGEVPAVITLKYADPEDLAQRLNAMFSQTGTAATIPLSSRGLSEYSVSATTGQTTSGAANATTAGTYTPWWTRGQQNSAEAPISNIIGQVRFVPDNRSKSIMV
ncbi:MAG TPA: secretin N-terminal domain-containing protein, partial [Sedimentisphaerales bacterium]|nr:secretin N-terminal domain-containing protein [Sedimentisphaerales bacterium]